MEINCSPKHNVVNRCFILLGPKKHTIYLKTGNRKQKFLVPFIVDFFHIKTRFKTLQGHTTKVKEQYKGLYCRVSQSSMLQKVSGYIVYGRPTNLPENIRSPKTSFRVMWAPSVYTP